MALMTFTAYATHRGVSRPAVSKYVAQGRLTAAVVKSPEGRELIDSDVADRLLEATLDPSARAKGRSAQERWKTRTGCAPEPGSNVEPDPELSPVVLPPPIPDSKQVAPRAVPVLAPTAGELPVGDFQAARALRESIMAQRAQLELDKARGDLIPLSQAKVDGFRVARDARNALLAIPERICPQLTACSDLSKNITLLTYEITLALEELTKKLETNA